MTATADSPPKPPLRQEIRFCTASDGIRIAYAEVGAGPPLLKTANWLNHLESDWQSPIWSHLLHALAAEHRLIRYDARGNGLSDWHVDDISFDAFVRDLESVVEAAGLDGFRYSAFHRAAPSRLPMPCGIPSASATWCSTADLPAVAASAAQPAKSSRPMRCLR